MSYDSTIYELNVYGKGSVRAYVQKHLDAREAEGRGALLEFHSFSSASLQFSERKSVTNGQVIYQKKSRRTVDRMGPAHALPLEMRGWLRLAGGHARGFYRYLF